MEISSRYKEAFELARQSPEYWTELALLDLSRQLVLEMRRLGLTQRALADLLEKKPSYVSRFFKGQHNVTIGTAATIAHALGMHLDIKLAPNGTPKRRHSFIVTSGIEGAAPQEGVVVRSHKLRLVKCTNESYTSNVEPGRGAVTVGQPRAA
ncbi:helix-turn-helix protein [Cupriavidus plantarum]|nr:helix-turn-helix protein [Cupriavidus plantarum]